MDTTKTAYEVQNNQKPVKMYIVVTGKDSQDQQKVSLYFQSVEDAFMETVKAKAQGMQYIKVFQEIDLKLTAGR